MCRVLGAVASRQLSIRHELLEAENPFIRQSEEHDSGWGMAVYGRAEGEEPRLVRFASAAFADPGFEESTELRGRIFNAHVRRATLGGLSLANTHPFSLGAFSFSHNGTVIDFPRLRGNGVADADGETDSEQLFHFLMSRYSGADPVGSFREGIGEVIRRSPFSGLNFLFSDGERLFAYRLGIFDLHWLERDEQVLVSSERATPEPWHVVQQDVLLVLDPARPGVHAERLVGDDLVAAADIRKFEEGAHLRGEERGAFAAERVARITAQAHAP